MKNNQLQIYEIFSVALTQKEFNFAGIAKESLTHNLGNPKRKGRNYGNKRQTGISCSNTRALS